MFFRRWGFLTGELKIQISWEFPAQFWETSIYFPSRKSTENSQKPTKNFIQLWNHKKTSNKNLSSKTIKFEISGKIRWNSQIVFLFALFFKANFKVSFSLISSLSVLFYGLIYFQRNPHPTPSKKNSPSTHQASDNNNSIK
jgi:hypothetical protein